MLMLMLWSVPSSPGLSFLHSEHFEIWVQFTLSWCGRGGRVTFWTFWNLDPIHPGQICGWGGLVTFCYILLQFIEHSEIWIQSILGLLHFVTSEIWNPPWADMRVGWACCILFQFIEYSEIWNLKSTLGRYMRVGWARCLKTMRANPSNAAADQKRGKTKD